MRGLRTWTGNPFHDRVFNGLAIWDSWNSASTSVTILAPMSTTIHSLTSPPPCGGCTLVNIGIVDKPSGHFHCRLTEMWTYCRVERCSHHALWVQTPYPCVFHLSRHFILYTGFAPLNMLSTVAENPKLLLKMPPMPQVWWLTFTQKSIMLQVCCNFLLADGFSGLLAPTSLPLYNPHCSFIKRRKEN